jgi:hypothetical protein
MKLTENNQSELEKWISARLTKLNLEEPDSYAKDIVAVLLEESSDLKELCTTELYPLLGESVYQFVEDLFQLLEGMICFF